MAIDTSGRDLPHRLTAWAAWTSALVTLAFLLTLVAIPFMAPLPTEWRGAADYAEGFEPWTMLAIAASLLLVPPVLVLLAGFHHLTPPELRWASITALVFEAVYAAIVGANDYLQLVTVRGSLLAGRLDGLDPFVWTNPYSVFASLEALGYLSQAIAFAALIPVFAIGQYARAIRWLLAANLVLGVATIGVQFLDLYVLLFPGLVVWPFIFGPAMVLIALRLGAADRRAASAASLVT